MLEPITEEELETIQYEYRADDQDSLIVRQLVEEIRRIRELHEDALRQMKLQREKADRDIGRLQAENDRLKIWMANRSRAILAGEPDEELI
jgi:hypothetical protein